MLTGINILCFSASYGVALILELSRLWFRSGVRGAAMVLFAAAGLVAHSLFLINRVIAERAAPLSSEYDWYLAAAWVLAATYLYLFRYHARTAIGLFLLPLVLGLIGTAVGWADQEPFPRSQASRVWGLAHGGFLLAGTVAVIVGFAAGLMYLIQAWRLKHKLPPTRGLQLPSLEWLEKINGRAVVYSVLLLGVGVLSGVALNLVNHTFDQETVPWTDPLVLTSLLTLSWLVGAAVFSGFYRPARQGRKVAYLTVASFVFLLLLLAVSLFAPSQHRSRLAAGSSAPQVPAAGGPREGVAGGGR